MKPPATIRNQNGTSYLLCAEKTAPEKLGNLRPLTPKEFSAAIGEVRSAEWVRSECASGAIRTVLGPSRRPYLIPASELGRFRPSLEFAAV